MDDRCSGCHAALFAWGGGGLGALLALPFLPLAWLIGALIGGTWFLLRLALFGRPRAPHERWQSETHGRGVMR